MFHSTLIPSCLYIIFTFTIVLLHIAHLLFFIILYYLCNGEFSPTQTPPWFRHRPKKLLQALPVPLYASQIPWDSSIKLFNGLLLDGVYYAPANRQYEDALTMDNDGSVRLIDSCDAFAGQD